MRGYSFASIEGANSPTNPHTVVGNQEYQENASWARLAVTVEEAAHMLGVSRATLYKVIMRGEIESFTVGRARRIAISTLEQYARGGAAVSNSRGIHGQTG
jgi:excisionase family DNA binding protein